MKRFFIVSLFLISLISNFNLYSVDLPAPAEQQQTIDCPVCLEPLYSYEGPADFDTIITLPTREINGHNVCGHSFHDACLSQVVATGGDSCPECRTPLPLSSEYLSSFFNPQSHILDLSNKNLKTLRGLSNLKNKEHVEVISFENNAIREIPNNEFIGFTNLEEICFDNNQDLIFESEFVFVGLNLMVLSFQNCQLQTIPPSVFNSLVNLRHLDLSKNMINQIPQDLFEHLAGVEFLDLSHNQINVVNEGALDPLTTLRYFYFHNNRYQELPVGLFTPLTQLQEVWLSISLSEAERTRVRQEILAVAPDCSILFVDQPLENSDLADFFSEDDDYEDEDDYQGGDEDNDDSD